MFSTDAPVKKPGLSLIFKLPLPCSRQPLPLLNGRAQELLAGEFQGPLLRYPCNVHPVSCGRSKHDFSSDAAKPVVNAIRVSYRDDLNRIRRLMSLPLWKANNPRTMAPGSQDILKLRHSEERRLTRYQKGKVDMIEGPISGPRL